MAQGLPGAATRQMAILVGPAVSAVEVFGVYYGMTALGWRVSLAAAERTPPSSDLGQRLPVDVQLDALTPKTQQALYVPTGAPTDPATLAVMRRFAEDAVLAAVSANVEQLRLAGLEVGLANADQVVLRSGGVLTAARPGDLPALMHALESHAQDALRRAKAATGGVPP